MPILRYFLYVGGALLSLLLISNAVMPQMPLPSTLTSGSDLPVVRIHSDRKLPERVVFDTSSTVSSAPIPVIPSTKVAEAAVPTGPQAAVAPIAPAEISPKARVREAFAQLPETEPKVVSKPPPKRRIAKPRTTQPWFRVAQQPHFGLTTW